MPQIRPLCPPRGGICHTIGEGDPVLEKDEQCTAAAERYYQPIYRYCLLQLGGDLSAADDCVQETFLRMLEKKDSLDFTGNIRSWLYSTAYRVIKEYRQQTRREQEMCPDDLDVELVSAEQESSGAEDAARLLRSLSDEEYRLLEAYYDSNHGSKAAVAREYGMTMPQLYKRIQTLRLRLLRRQSDESAAKNPAPDCTNKQKSD